MGQQIIKQPNGKYALFSSNTDTFIALDGTPEEFIEMWLVQERERLTRRVKEIIGNYILNSLGGIE